MTEKGELKVIFEWKIDRSSDTRQPAQVAPGAFIKVNEEDLIK